MSASSGRLKAATPPGLPPPRPSCRAPSPHPAPGSGAGGRPAPPPPRPSCPHPPPAPGSGSSVSRPPAQLAQPILERSGRDAQARQQPDGRLIPVGEYPEQDVLG